MKIPNLLRKSDGKKISNLLRKSDRRAFGAFLSIFEPKKTGAS